MHSTLPKYTTSSQLGLHSRLSFAAAQLFASILDCLYHLLKISRCAVNVSRVLIAHLKGWEGRGITEKARARQERRSHALQTSPSGKEKGCRIQQPFQGTVSVFKGWGTTTRHFYTTFSPTDRGNNSIASLILQYYGAIIWLSASFGWAIPAFASINHSYPDSVVGQPRLRVSLGVDQRDTLSGSAYQTLICKLFYRDGSTPCPMESSKTPPPAQRRH